ncbi:MAG: hypothetical protein C4293_06535 [Nitrospiraceae bacterium]
MSQIIFVKESRITSCVLLLFGVMIVRLFVPPSAFGDTSPIPQLGTWESNMITYGRQACRKLSPGADTVANQLGNVYYDAVRVYYQVATYTGDPTWKYCAGLAKALYRDGYVLPINGRVAGWQNFTTGLLMDYQRTGDTKSRDAIVQMAQNASFAEDGTPLDFTASTGSSREVAYVIMAYLNAEAVGQPRRPRLADMINQALGHMDQWFISKTAPYVRPFMVGITMQALIQAYEATQDSRIPSAIAAALDDLWARTWLPDHQAFMYTDRHAPDGSGGTDPAPDLNLIIAPAYAWMYYQTGNTIYRDRGDQVFAGGVTNAQNWLYLGKQFDQSYWWSFSYITWRHAAVPGKGVVPSTPSNSSSPTTSISAPPASGPTSITPDMPRGTIKRKN